MSEQQKNRGPRRHGPMGAVARRHDAGRKSKGL